MPMNGLPHDGADATAPMDRVEAPSYALRHGDPIAEFGAVREFLRYQFNLRAALAKLEP